MVRSGEELLEQNDVPITNRNLRLLGLGARLVNRLRHGSKAHSEKPVVGPNQ